MRMTRTTLGIALVATLALASCAPAEAPTPEPEATPVVTFEPAVSINRVMVDLVNDHATLLWEADLTPPETDEEWIALRHAATAVTAAGSITSVGGSGDDDMAWAARPEWDQMSQVMTDVGAQMLIATERRNLDQLLALGNDLVNTCIGCHNMFRLDVPDIWSERAQEIPVAEQ